MEEKMRVKEILVSEFSEFEKYKYINLKDIDQAIEKAYENRKQHDDSPMNLSSLLSLSKCFLQNKLMQLAKDDTELTCQIMKHYKYLVSDFIGNSNKEVPPFTLRFGLEVVKNLWDETLCYAIDNYSGSSISFEVYLLTLFQINLVNYNEAFEQDKKFVLKQKI